MFSKSFNPKKIVRPFVEFSYRYWFLYLLVLLILIVRSSFYETYRIPTHSMTPTLINGDYIVVNKMAYGFRLPFSELFYSIYPFGFRQPKRGEIIVFKFPKDPSTSYVKRVIGLPGDTIEIKKKKLFLNDKIVDRVVSTSGPKDYFQRLTEKLGDLNYVVQYDTNNHYKVDYKKVVIPKDHYFVMGDNRDYSYDSRFWGFVSTANIEGRVQGIWLSLVIPSASESFIFRPNRSFISF